MAGEDHIRFEASFAELDADVARVKSILEEQLTKAQALGDTALEARVRSQLAHPALGGTGQAQADAQLAAATRLNALKRLGAELDVQSLDLIEQQTAAMAEQAAVLARERLGQTIDPQGLSALERGLSLVVPSVRPSRTYEQTAGGLAAQEEALRVQQEQLRIEQEQVVADEERRRALAEQLALQRAIQEHMVRSYQAGAVAATAGRPVDLPVANIAGFTEEQAAMAKLNAELGQYDVYARQASVSSQALSANFTRLGLAEAEAGNQLRRHGALTTEFLGALARGETTVNEFGYQIGATIGKFAGWTAAATATYGALGAVAEFGKGAIDAASGVQQLTRTIDGLDREKANRSIINLSAETNVPIKEAADAIFQYSRTFHDLDSAAAAAKLGLSAFKLDQVDLATNVKTATSLYTQFGVSVAGQRTIYDELSAGQREFNARMQQTIPLLGRAGGAAKNAGGDLNQLVQIAITAQRLLPNLGGTQIGTALYRSAATFLNPNTTKGQADRAVVEKLGVNINQGFTEIIQDAIARAAKLSQSDSQKLSLALFGPQYGGRLSGLFTPEGAATQAAVQRRITPEATRGSLQQELTRELDTARERLHSFVNEMQRTGAAIADSGILPLFTGLLHGLVTVGGGVRDVIQTFDGLPPALKETVAGLLLLRSAMLFLNRTRFGASFGPLSRVARIPGIDPNYEAQQARAQLAIGTRAAMKAVEDEVSQNASALTASAARQASLERQRAAVQREINAGTGDTAALIERSNVLNQQIRSLDAEQVRIETERNASLEALSALKAQQVGLTATNRNARLSDAEVLALQGRVAGAGQSATAASEASTKTAEADAATEARLAQWRERSGRALLLDAEAIRAQGAATAVQTEAADAALVATEATVAETEANAGRLAAFASRARGLAAALDPLLVAIVGIPFLISEIHKLSDAAAKAVQASSAGDFHSLSDLNAAAAKADRANQSPKSLGPSLGGLNPFQESEDSFNARRDAADQLVNLQQAIIAARQRTFASPVKQVGYTIQELSNEAAADAKAFQEHKITKDEFIRRMDELKRSAGSSLEVLTATSAKQANNAITEATGQIKSVLGNALTNAAKTTKDFLSALDSLDTKQLTANVKAYSDRSQVYGLNSGDLRKAGETYLFLAARYRNSSDPAGLQLVQQAEQALVQAVNKNVQDMLNAAQSATSFQGASTDISTAIGDISRAREGVKSWVAAIDQKFKHYPSIIRAVNEAAKQIDAQFDQQLKTALDQQTQLIEQQASLRAAQVTGISPEADIQRAQITLQGLQQAYAKAKAEGADYQTLAALLLQIDQQIQSIAQQKIANARSILEAQNTLATSQITGTGPGADLARAQQGVAAAQRILAFDQAHHAGQAQILQDEAAVNDATRSLNEQIKAQAQQQSQDLQAFIQSQVDLQTSETLNPVKQLREQLAGALRLLATIKPSDFNTQQEYQTARNEALAKVNQQRTSLNDQIVQTDLRNLQFEHDIHRIGDQQYVDGLRKILRNKKLTTEERQQILTDIYNITHQGSTLDLNVGNIKFPSIYQIRRAIGLGQRGVLPGQTNTTINHRAVVNVYVNGQKGASAVGKVLDDHLNTSVRSAMRSAGVI